MARLDRVAVSKEIAQVGSVIGREFSYELIAGLELMSEEALGKGLRHLTASGLATCHGEIPNAVYTFSHALVQDAAYDSLLKSRRKQLHGDIAHLLEERWPETRDQAPGIARLPLQRGGAVIRVAAPLWLRAGEVAMRAFCAARSHHPFAHRHVGIVETAAVQGSRPHGNLAANRAGADAGGVSRLGPGGGQRTFWNRHGGWRSRSSKATPICRS